MICRLLETTKVKGAILVSACYTDLGIKNERASGYYKDPWQWDNIKQNAEWIVQFGSEVRFIHICLFLFRLLFVITLFLSFFYYLPCAFFLAFFLLSRFLSFSLSFVLSLTIFLFLSSVFFSSLFSFFFLPSDFIFEPKKKKG